MRRVLLIVIALIALLAIGLFVFITLAERTSASGFDQAISDLAQSGALERNAEPGLPRQGVYPMAVTGSESISRAPLSVDRDFPTEAPLIVRHTADGYETEARYSSDHVEGVGYRLGEGGAEAISGTTTVSLASFSTTRDREWTPAPLRLPLEPKVGQSWEGDYLSGTLEVHIASEVTRRDTVDVGGTAVPVMVIESTQTIGGEYSGERAEQFFYSPGHGMVVRYTIASKLAGPINITFEVDQTLTSLEPLSGSD